MPAQRRLNRILSHLRNEESAPSLASNGTSAFFDNVKPAPPDAVFGIKNMAKKDTSSLKIDLGVGAYRDNNGKPYVLQAVKEAEKRLLADTSLNKEYLGITGDPTFLKLARELIFGANSIAIRQGRVASSQSLSGTGGLRLGFEFLAKFHNKPVYISDPTWGNHKTIITESGLSWKTHRYWDAKNRCLDIEGMLEDLNAAPEGSIVLLHACAHNPTGVDPTRAQWKRIADVMKRRNLFPFMDNAYQGFATGSLENDAWAIRYFADQGFEMVCSQSFAKNFGLYGERVGGLHVVCNTMQAAKGVTSRLSKVVRPMYSNPPKHGAYIVRTVLGDPQLFALWKREIKGMADRILAMREALKRELIRNGTPGNWDHITSQIGMFSYTGLSKTQATEMMHKHHVYLLYSGRISMAGLNTGNVKRFAGAIKAVHH